MTSDVIVSQDNGVVRITLNRPTAGNAVTPKLIAGLAGGVAAASSPTAKAVLINAAGPNFCVGADLRHFEHVMPDIDVELGSMARAFHKMLGDLASLPVPIIAAVQGNAVGAGFGLALVADIVIASEKARFSTGYARLGLSADAGVSFALTRALGPRLARSLLISARFLDAGEAAAMGLVDRIVDEGALQDDALGEGRMLAGGPTHAYAAIKRLTSAAAAQQDLRVHLECEEAEILPLARDPRVVAAMKRMLERRN